MTLADLYKDITAESLLQRMLDRYRHEFDKREGSLTWDEFANVAVELRHMYIQLDWMWQQMFGDTADREHLIRLAADRDITPHLPTPAVLVGEFNLPIAEGERFNLRDLNYIVTSVEEDAETGYRYLLTCETPGTAGNITYGTFVPIRPIPGLTHSVVVAVAVPGENEEDTEAFRERYYETLRSNKYGFNIAEYQSQVDDIPGVGAVRVYPADPEPGHVRLVILSSDWGEASSVLVSQVQEILDPVPYQQMGVGRVPIGHQVKVEAAQPDTINVRLRIVLASGTNQATVEPEIREAIEQYLLELRMGFSDLHDPLSQNQAGMMVRQAHIETRVLSVPGVVDVTGTWINGVEGNYNPPKDSIPVLGAINYV